MAELFRDLRAASGLSEADLASQLATRPEVVQALETGAIYALPPWNETCRVVTGYGALLNLDVRPLLRRIYAQVEAGVVELAPKPIPEVPFMPPAQNGARGPGSSWSSTPFNQSAPPASNRVPPRPPEKASPFPLPFNEPMPGEPRPQKASPFPLPFNEPAPGRSQSEPASSLPPVRPPKGPLSGFGPPPAGAPPAYPTGGPSRQAPPSKPAFSPDLKPARRTPDPLAVAEATRAKVKENLADAKAKGKPRRGLLKWGVLALVASGTAFGLWLWLSQADLGGTSGSQTVEEGASKDEAQPPTASEGGPDPRSRKADRLPGPS